MLKLNVRRPACPVLAASGCGARSLEIGPAAAGRLGIVAKQVRWLAMRCQSNITEARTEAAVRMIDAHRTVRRLTDAGMEERQAEALASALYDVFDQWKRASLPATTSDLTAALNSFKVQYIAWRIAIAVALAIALKVMHVV